MTDTQNPNPLIDPNFKWVTGEGKPTTEFYHYLRALDRTMRVAVGVINTPETPLPVALWNEYLEVACSDELAEIEAGAAQVTFRMPYAMELSEVRASLQTAQASGSIFTVDINQNGASILSTKLTIDNTEKTSKSAATQPVISTASLTDDAEMTVDVDQIGNGTAIGLKIILIGSRAP